jgi:colanic acid/amylovoran biosynthesis protein
MAVVETQAAPFRGKRKANAPRFKLCLVGAATDTTNLGVSALCYSTLSGLFRRSPNTDIAVFDNGRGVRDAELQVGDSKFPYKLCGATNSRRYYRRESYWNIRVSTSLGGMGNPAAKLFLRSDAILDVSGGDSFCDLYGPRVFRANTTMKKMALAHGVPLVLLPQTYGPFNDPEHRRIAQGIMRAAAMAWARDARSFDTLRDMLGHHFDPARHRCGVDLAFGLEPRRSDNMPAWLIELLQDPDKRPIGINVSGLIYNDPEAARSRYGFVADYRKVIHGLLARLLRHSDRPVLLVPHVVCDPGLTESDSAACEAVMQTLDAGDRQRVFLLPRIFDPSETKWIISRTEWFCSTRMHAAIGALSSGVPSAAIAYSLKTLGVFETCGQGAHVADPRTASTEQVIEQLWSSWEVRRSAAAALQNALFGVKKIVAEQMDTLTGYLSTLIT